MALKALTKPEFDLYLAHYGKKGMRWGIKKAKTKRLQDGKSKVDNILKVHGKTKLGKAKNKAPIKIEKSHSKVTQAVIKDYNSMSNRDFFRKYVTTKRTYKKRVDKHGDPYTHAVDRLRENKGLPPIQRN